MADELTSVADIDFDFENSTIRILVLREIPAQKFAQVQVGQEIEVPYWTARELVKDGYARFRPEDTLNYTDLNKAHWRETGSNAKKLSALPPTFFCLLRRYLAALREASKKDLDTYRELTRSENLARDIVNARVRKIVTFAVTPKSKETEELLKNLTAEERALYSVLKSTVGEWRAGLLPE